MAIQPSSRHSTSASDLDTPANGSPVDHGDDLEKARASESRSSNSLLGLKMRLHSCCTVKAGWVMTTYKAWEKQHAYDSPVHPAISFNYPDPALLYYKKRFYAFATNNASGILFRPRNASTSGYGMANIQLASSEDLFKPWTLQAPAQQPLAHVGTCANVGMTREGIGGPSIPKAQAWSPGIVQRTSDKHFVLYYAVATTPKRSGIRPGHCIGAAVSVSKSPLGSYMPLDKPLVCDVERGGAIDPSPFKDEGGDLYLAYKIDGNNVRHGGQCGNMVEPIVPTPIMLQKMLDDGVSPDGRPVQILDRTEADGPLVEAPTIVRSKEGVYFLFYSSGCTRDPNYDIKYATSESVTGPYVRAPTPLLSTGDWGLEAPGSPSIIENPKEEGYVMAFHSRKQTAEGGVRAMSWSKLYLEGRHANLVNQVELGRLKLHPH